MPLAMPIKGCLSSHHGGAASGPRPNYGRVGEESPGGEFMVETPEEHRAAELPRRNILLRTHT